LLEAEAIKKKSEDTKEVNQKP